MAKPSIDELVADLRRRSAEVVPPPDSAQYQKQHEKGKLHARERLDLLLDPGSFWELDRFVTHRCVNFDMPKTRAPGEGVVSGGGTIDGRPVFVYSQDFGVLGGSLGEAHAAKITKVMDLALKAGAPLIGINDSGGARIQEGVDSLHGYGSIFVRNVRASGVIPQISLILGPCAGGAVYSPALTDFVFMVQNVSHMFITGPQVIKAVSGEEVSEEELGGASTHARLSGVCQMAFPDERSCLAGVRALLSYLPQNNLEDPPARECGDPLERRDPALRELVPVDGRQSYDVREVIRRVLDRDSFFEIQAEFAPNLVIGYARLAGFAVGVVANQPAYLAGSLDINASDKASRFVRTCDAFNVPLLTFVDTPGYLPGKNQEFGGIIRHGAKLLYAYSEATVPKLTVTLRKAYGGAYIAMCNRDLGADFQVAWPQAEIAVMGAAGAANIIHRKEIEAAPDKNVKRQEKIDEYERLFSNPYEAAKHGMVDAVVEPEETRPALARALLSLRGKRESLPGRKHGNIPL